MVTRFFNREGESISLDEWSMLGSTPGYSSVIRTRLSAAVVVSTVWLGMDTSLRDGPPMIFETMIFAAGRAQLIGRWPTEAAAIAGHDQTVAAVKERLP